LDLAAELQPLGPDAEYIRIQGTGRNALDFHIAYYIGCLSAASPGSTIYIVCRRSRRWSQDIRKGRRRSPRRRKHGGSG
jgi:hypothetical protein